MKKNLLLFFLLSVVGVVSSYADLVDGVYQISSAQDFTQFAEYVQTNPNTDAVVTDDFTTSTMVGTWETPYAGKFDGGRHTITVEFSGGNDCALFAYLSGEVSNLRVNGTIQVSGQFAGGIVSHIKKRGKLYNCQSSVTIQSTRRDDGTHGGIVGLIDDYTDAEFVNCVFDGVLTGEQTNSCGQLCGWAGNKSTSAVFNNCFALGDVSGIGAQSSNTISRNPGVCQFINCYYKDQFGDTPYGCKQVADTDIQEGILIGPQAQYKLLQNGVADIDLSDIYSNPLCYKNGVLEYNPTIEIEEESKTHASISGKNLTIRGEGIVNLIASVDGFETTLKIHAVEPSNYAGYTIIDKSAGQELGRDCSSAKILIVGIPSNAEWNIMRSLASETLEDIAILGQDIIPSRAFYSCRTLKTVNVPLCTSIGDEAFSDCSSLSSIEIPSSVTSIGAYAFNWCTSLTSIELPSSVTSIGAYAFRGCSTLTSITIPEGVTSIGNAAFGVCSSLTSIEFPSSLTSIGNLAFDGCSSLTSIELPSSVTLIGYAAFARCSSLSSIILPSSLNSIEFNTFEGCSSLTSIGDLSACTSIGSSAFDGCSSLTSIGDLSACTSIRDWAFSGCTSLTSIGDLSACTSIGGSAFSSCTSLTSIGDLPACTSIGSGAFFSCTSLTSIGDLPACTSIGSAALEGCSSLASIGDLSACTNIGYEAFWNCTSLTSFEMPESMTSIGNKAFYGCSSLESIYIKNIAAWFNISGLYNLTESGPSKTLYVNGEAVEDVVIENGPTSIPDYAFYLFKNIQTVSIPSSVTSIGNYAFYNCTSLTSIEIPTSVTSIGNSAFEYCTSLTSVEILEGVTSIGNYAFYNCTSLTSIEIPSSVTSIGNNTFQYCSSLASIEIPSSVISIGSSAFTGCSALWKITMEGPAPSSVTNTTFGTQSSLVVPDAAYDDYKAAWTGYTNQITIASQSEREVTVTANDTESAIHRAVGEENLRHVLSLKVNGSINGYDIMLLRNKMINLHSLDLSNATIVGNDYEYYTGYHTTDNEIGPYAFYSLKNLFSVKLPEVTVIQNNAFQGCSNLYEVTLPKSLTTIQPYSFGGCENLCEITLPESLTTLESHAFSGCESLQRIEIPASVETIGDCAFNGCYALKTLTLNEGLNEIGASAFANCKIIDIRFPESLKTINDFAFVRNSFEELNLPPNLNTIGYWAFENCYNLRVVRLNPMLKNISDNAFGDCHALEKVYTYTLEPTGISQNTFSNYETAGLYVPTPSYYTYYYNTQWSQFLSVNKSDEEYDFKSFYLTKDYEMDDNTGILGGDPDAELNENSGLINSGSETQELGTVTIRFNGNNGSASIIANGNLTAEKIKVEITITGNKWHFFCFPFDVPLSGVSTSGNKAFVFRHYNAEKRATGASGWENLPNDQTVLTAGEGYIFQANGNATLTIEVDNKTTFVGENVATALKVQDATNVANASWNFKGNPGYAYFDIDDLGFTAPITVWDPNTNNYVALRPGDDDAFIHPFQAFFVQKPDGTDALTFNAEDRTTYLGSQKSMAKKAARRREADANADNLRKLINLTLTDGQTTDKTRVVFNNEKSMDYEMECDAAKFASAGVSQFYSLDNNNTHYAINERPYGDGLVRLGFTAEQDGTFSIEAVRMDTPCYLRDLQLNITHDLSVGAYEFQSKKGVHEGRFVLVNTADANDPTGIESIELNDIAEDAVIYDLQGRQVQRAQHGVYIINGKKLNVK